MAEIKPLKIDGGSLARVVSGDTIPNEHLNGDFNTGNNTLRIPTATSDPASPSDGQIYFNTTDKVLKIAVSGVWIPIGVTQ